MLFARELGRTLLRISTIASEADVDQWETWDEANLAVESSDIRLSYKRRPWAQGSQFWGLKQGHSGPAPTRGRAYSAAELGITHAEEPANAPLRALQPRRRDRQAQRSNDPSALGERKSQACLRTNRRATRPSGVSF